MINRLGSLMSVYTIEYAIKTTTMIKTSFIPPFELPVEVIDFGFERQVTNSSLAFSLSSLVSKEGFFLGRIDFVEQTEQINATIIHKQLCN